MTFAYVFPGQGSQFVGMGSAFYQQYSKVRHVFEAASDALRQDMAALIFESDTKELNLTVNAQPALMTISVAISCVLQDLFGVPQHGSCLAGHSLGEYTALCVAGAFSFEDIVALVRYRGQVMQDSSPLGAGKMAAILGLSLEKIEELITSSHLPSDRVCVVANDNCPGQIVISGHTDAVDLLSQKAREGGAKRVVALPVSAPFHSPLMAQAAERMEEALLDISQKPFTHSVIANVDVQPFHTDNVKSLLVQQMTGRVRWRETIDYFHNHNITHVVEVGAGNVLSGLVQRTQPSIHTLSIQTPDKLSEWEHILAA